jgi:DNA-binding XRE family transcriptional regulator
MVPGLQTVEGTLTLYASYGASEVEATLAAQVGLGTTTIVVKKESGAISASNPEWTISNTMIANNAYAYTVGELQVFEVSFSGGTWVRDITP